MYSHFFKRVVDFILVLLVLLVIWPILLIITIWLHFANKGAGAFFFQDRPGYKGKIFKVIKFKTMSEMQREICFPITTESRRWVRLYVPILSMNSPSLSMY